MRKSLVDFGELLKARGLNINSYDSIEYLYDQIEHPLTELTKFVKKQPSEIASNKSAVVFADSLQKYFDELRKIVSEIDQEYASPPEPVVQPRLESRDIPMVFVSTASGKKGKKKQVRSARSSRHFRRNR